LNRVLIIGSAPDAVAVKNWDLSVFSSRVAINNAWQLRPDWDFLIYPEDFAEDRLPTLPAQSAQRLVTAREYVPVQNHYGGFVYAGGTMAFTAAYWALGALNPDLIAFVGCDMVYATAPGHPTHFYGNGTADPLRADVTLQSLEAKTVRLMSIAHRQHCQLVNLSQLPQSRLLFPRRSLQEVESYGRGSQSTTGPAQVFNGAAVATAFRMERELGYMVPSGRYWEVSADLDKTKLQAIDSMWLDALAS
jgi:hypothetical protein